MSFGPFTFDSNGDGDGFIFKMDPSQNILWATSFGSTVATSFETGSTMSLDGSGNCYVASTFADDCKFFLGPTLETNSTKNVLIAAYGPGGNYLWARAFRGGPGAKFSPVTLSIFAEENVLLTGIFAGIDTIEGVALQPFTNTDSADAFIISFNPVGDLNWAIHAGGPWNDGGFGIAGNNSAFAFATGNYRETAQFGPINLVSSGVSDFWVAKFEKTTVTGNASVPGNKEFQAFPNPFSDQLIISLPDNTTELKIFNSTGQVVLERTVSKSDKQLSIDFADKKAGVYTIQLKGDYGITTGKIEKGQ
jgi:hypothetical protein